MSWKGFTKAVSRMPHTLLSKPGTVDQEYEDMAEYFKQAESSSKKLFDDSRRFKDSLNMMVAYSASFAQTIAETFAPITPSTSRSGSMSDLSALPPSYTPQSDQEVVALEIATEFKNVRELLLPDLEVIERQIIAPTAELMTLFEIVKKLMHKRGNKLIDFDRHSESYKRLSEKVDKNSADEKRLYTLSSTLDQATREYNNVNQLLKQQLPVFFQLKESFISPCFITIFMYQHKMNQIIRDSLSKVVQRHYDMSLGIIPGYTAVQGTLDEMLKTLTIVKRFKNASSADLIGSGSIDSSAAALPPSYDDLHQSPQPPKMPALEKMNLGAGAAAAGMAGSSSYNHPSPPLPSPATRPIPKTIDMVTALYDFEAQAPGDLSFKEGDRIIVIKRTESANDWWTGTLNGVTGQFPGNYVQ